MIGKAFASAHITGFFYVYDHDDPLKLGSCGCGFTLEYGFMTEVRTSARTEIYLNGELTDVCTNRTVVELLTDRPVRVDSTFAFPIGGGFGASGAGAFGTALALNKALGLKKTYNELAQDAHMAEVINRTGLGDVAGMSQGGIVIRLKPGTPFVLDRIPANSRDIYSVYFGPISTRGILSDTKAKALINEAGRKCLKSLLKEPTFERFMALSREFSISTGLASDRAIRAIESVESQGGMASMAMLGDTVFSTIPDGLSEFGKVMKSRVSLTPAHPL